MINLDNLKQNIIDMEYGCNAKSLVLLVPALSFLVQKIKMQNLFDILENTDLTLYNVDQFYSIGDKNDHIYKWHVTASMIQMITSLLLLDICPPICVLPLFGISIGSIYQSYKAVTQHNDFVDRAQQFARNHLAQPRSEILRGD